MGGGGVGTDVVADVIDGQHRQPPLGTSNSWGASDDEIFLSVFQGPSVAPLAVKFLSRALVQERKMRCHCKDATTNSPKMRKSAKVELAY